jgi:hypothetical protein
MVIETVLANIAHVLNIFGSLFVLVNLVILQFIKKKEKMYKKKFEINSKMVFALSSLVYVVHFLFN